MSARVQGFCPMGCGGTLFLGSGGYITCSLIGCPNPTAASDILDDPEHEHIVELGEETFTVRHPLRERLGEALMECDLHQWLHELPGLPRRPGRYRVRGPLKPDKVSEPVGWSPWTFEAVPHA